MIVRKFLAWTWTAPAAARAEGTAALARAYLADELDPGDRADAEGALTALLDDGSPLVRHALAAVLAPAPGAPRHLLTALIADRSDIAALILEASPVLAEPELVDAVAVGDAVSQSAVARRPYLGLGVAAAIAEVATLPACLALCRNESASIAPLSLGRLLERFGGEPELRELLARRPDLDPGLRHDLALATARSLEAFVTACGWLPAERAGRVTREAAEQAALTLADAALREDGAAGTLRLAEHLRATGRLTAALLLRAVLGGNLALFEAALSVLSGMPIGRVAGLARGASGLGFAALYGRAGLPAHLLPVFAAALREAQREEGGDDLAAPGLRRGAIARVIAACAPAEAAELGTVTGLLRQFEAEAARAAARAFAETLARERMVPALPPPEPRRLALRPAA